MGRPLTGSRTRLADGRWRGSLPVALGSRKRTSGTFATESEMDAWIAAGVAALTGGGVVPEVPEAPEPSGSSVGSVPHPVAATAEAWYRDYYDQLEKAGPERAAEVRRSIDRYILPRLTAWLSEWSDLERQHTVRFVRELAGRHLTRDDATTLDDEETLTVEVAAEVTSRSVATVRRWNRQGRLAGTSYDDAGRLRIPLGSLRSAGLVGEREFALMRSTAADVVWILGQILEHAVAQGELTETHMKSITAMDPVPWAVRQPDKLERRPVAVSLGRCAQLAARLHPIHQMTMWLLRIVGLRISEAFGIRVGDIVDLGEFGLLTIFRQGGRGFLRREPDGTVVAVDSVEHTKTSASRRIIVVPASLMQAIRVIVAAYHTCPDTGTVNVEARLIPGIQRPDVSGQCTFRSHLGAAFRAEGLETDLEFAATSHDLRKSVASDLAWTGELDALWRRRFLGHLAGADVHDRVYTLDLEIVAGHPEVGPLAAIAARLDAMVADEIDSLIVPTSAASPQFGAKHPVRDRIDHADMVFGTAGWIRAADAEDRCTTAQVAELLDLPVSTARKLISRGDLASETHRDDRGFARRVVTRAAVVAFRDERENRMTVEKLAERMGLSYHQAYTELRRRYPDVETHGRGLVVTEQMANELLAEAERVRQLHRRAVRISAAAERLSMGDRTVRRLVAYGDLDLDPESDASGVHFVTIQSIERYEVTLSGPQPDPVATGPTVGLAELRRVTGLSAERVTALARAGLLDQVSIRGCQYTIESVRRWMAGFRPELLLELDDKCEAHP